MPTGPSVADVLLVPAANPEVFVVPAGTNWTTPETSQSPGVKLTLVIFAVAPLDSDTPEAEFEITSPTLPAAALEPSVTPIKFGNVAEVEAVSVVKAPAAPVTLPPVMVGVTIDGLFWRTTLPVPVAAVAPVPPFAIGKVPVTPVVSGRPVAFASVTAGPFASTTLPVPVEVVVPVPPLATARVPPRVSVPEVVIGEPVKVSPVVPPLAATLVTVPLPEVAMVWQVKPVIGAQFRAWFVVLHWGMGTAVGDAVVLAALPSRVLAACVARSAGVTNPVAVKLFVTVVPPVADSVPEIATAPDAAIGPDAVKVPVVCRFR